MSGRVDTPSEQRTWQDMTHAYLQHDVEGQQGQDNQFVTVKQATPCVVEHHIRAGVQQSLQADLQKQGLHLSTCI